VKKPVVDVLAPRLVDDIPMPEVSDAQFDLPFISLEKENEIEEPVQLKLTIKEETNEVNKEKLDLEAKKKQLNDKFEQLRQNILGSNAPSPNTQNSFPSPAASGGYLARPSNIYAESTPEVSTSKPAEEPVPAPVAKTEDEESFDMHLVIRNDIPAADLPAAQQTQVPTTPQAEDSRIGNDAEEEKRRAAERLQKLRNLSFNISATDPNNEFDAVPAYIRRNMELYNNTSSVENFYSKYIVKSDGANGVQISTINTFLDGKKPD
jgi:cell division protein FtsZ